MVKTVKEKKSILFVDDDENILFIGKFVLKKLNYKVITAENGEDAIRLFRENQEDIFCIILDFTMPGMSASECLQKLKKINSSAKIILSTGYDQEDLPDNLIIDGFLHKPYNLDTLKSKILEVVNN